MNIVSRLAWETFGIISSGVAIMLTISYAMSRDIKLSLISGLIFAGTLFIPP